MPNVRADRWRRVMNAGERMSNWFFNMSQMKHEHDAHTREVMREMVKEWDESRRAMISKVEEAQHGNK